MSKTRNLKVNTRLRSGSGALKAMRREDLVPAVIYGANQENLNLKIGERSFRDLLHGSASEQILVNLEIEDQGATKLALIQAVQHDALSGRILHVDFHAIREDELIHASVPVGLVGESVGVKKGGLLEQQIHALEIQCLPKDLPEGIECDISDVDLGGAFHVSELTFPDGVTATLEGDVVVALVQTPRVADTDEESEESEKEATEEDKAPAAE